MSLSDRIYRLEASSPTSKAERWRVAIERHQRICDAASDKLIAMLAESAIDPDQLPPQTPEEEATAKRELLDALKAAVRESQSV